MKRIFALLTCICTLLLSACSRDVRADEVLVRALREYPLEADVYSSLNKEGEDGFVDSEMLIALYGVSEHPTAEFALALYGKVDTVREIGVFSTDGGADIIGLTELLERRLDFLASASDGEKFLKKYKGAIVYAFVGDASRIEAIFDSLI